jgi:hypothetical protein
LARKKKSSPNPFRVGAWIEIGEDVVIAVQPDTDLGLFYAILRGGFLRRRAAFNDLFPENRLKSGSAC